MPCSPAVVAGDLSGLWIDAIGVAEAFGQPGQIGDYGMDMALRIRRTARVVLEKRVNEIAGPNRNILPADMNARFGKILFGPRHRFLHRLDVRGENTGIARD